MSAPSRKQRAQSTSNGMRGRAGSDPLNKWLEPAGEETPEQRASRLEQEAVAQKVSDAIDEQLRREKAELSKKKKEVRILLLGQSESGKSTTLKQFQLLYAPSSFTTEAPAWRPIIYLNLVRSIRRILEVITYSEMDYADYDRRSIDEGTMASPPSSPTFDEGRPSISDAEIGAFTRIRQSLSPLLALEDRLITLLSHPDEDSGEATHLSELTPVLPNNQQPSNGREVGIGGGWKKALGKLSGRNRRNTQAEGYTGFDWSLDPEDPVHILQRCLPEMLGLWRNERVRDILRAKRIRLEETPGFYLNDMPRVTASDYVPSIDDVLKARLKTLGVVEHRFSLDKPQGSIFGKASASQAEVDWVIYDVGGARNQRHVWAPFFDD
ncbi:hypothetical protein FRC20_001079, partial [Serendipita sp. 405]